MNLLHTTLASMLTGLLLGCTGFAPNRLDLTASCTLNAKDPLHAPAPCHHAALEKIVADADPPVPAMEVAYVEFTDQGWLHSRKQMEQAVARVRPLADDPRPVQLVVFVHGWKHNAGFNDDNVSNFRRGILDNFAARVGPGVRTVGLYVGWRGDSININGLNNITFYDRKATAEHVARGSIRELFAHIRVLAEKSPRPDPSLRVVLIGHSFGGLIVFNAVADTLLDELVRAQGGGAPRSLFDLAVVLNPAFEASRFEPLFQVAKGSPPISASRPLFVSITASNDSATRTAFPFGRAVNSFFDHEAWTDQDQCPGGFAPSGECPTFDRALRLEKRANTQTMGHVPRYFTHDLTMAGDGRVDCRNMAAPPLAPGAAPALLPQALKQGNRFPLWTLRASREVVDNHSGIYNPELWRFLANLAYADKSADVDALCQAPTALPPLPAGPG